MKNQALRPKQSRTAPAVPTVSHRPQRYEAAASTNTKSRKKWVADARPQRPRSAPATRYPRRAPIAGKMR